jgi:hypothetical protein
MRRVWAYVMSDPPYSMGRFVRPCTRTFHQQGALCEPGWV